ncbi:MAG: mechanosensitive ion channel family protein [Thermoplasmata archaeon]|jgi:small conductance mechanosensitive channel|nr:mechanosensitive ion channel family protein [Thermoplasmata archaeon]
MVNLAVLGAQLAFLVPVAVIILVTVVLAWVVGLLVGRLTQRTSPHMAGAARRLAVIVVALIGGTLALQALGVSPDILLLVVALLGATALIALRDPLGNYGAKYFSDIYTPFKVGDTIQVGAYSGKVIEINPMATVLLSDKEQLISLPNAALLRDVVTNTSPQAWKEVTVPVTLPGSVDLPAFESELLKSLSKLRMRLDPRFPPVVTTKARSPQSTELAVTLMLRRPEDRDAITSETNKRLGEVLEQVRGARR